MTRDEAMSIAIEALGYVLDNDTEYLSEDAEARYVEAMRVLNPPLCDECASGGLCGTRKRFGSCTGR